MIARPIRAFAAALALTIAAPAFAQSAPAPAATAAHATKLALAKRYFAAMHMDRMMGPMMQSMASATIQALAKNNPSLTPQEQTALAEASAESSAAMIGQMMDRMAPIFADTFTEQELRELVAFYESPTGQAVMAKTPVVMAKFAPTLAEMMPQVQADMRKRLCAKTDCSKFPQPGS